MVIGTLIGFKVYSLIKGFWSLWISEAFDFPPRQPWKPIPFIQGHSPLNRTKLIVPMAY